MVTLGLGTNHRGQGWGGCGRSSPCKDIQPLLPDSSCGDIFERAVTWTVVTAAPGGFGTCATHIYTQTQVQVWTVSQSNANTFTSQSYKGHTQTPTGHLVAVTAHTISHTHPSLEASRGCDTSRDFHKDTVKHNHTNIFCSVMVTTTHTPDADSEKVPHTNTSQHQSPIRK